MPDVRLIVDSMAYGGWKSITVTRSIEQISGSYELSVSEIAPDGSAAEAIMPGSRAALSIDGELVITGCIDEIEISHNAQEHTITVRGRDAAGDLVDCAAIHKTGQWQDQGMLAIARDLIAPFGMKVSADVDPGKPFPQWNIEPGESVYENLDRMARHRGVILVSDGSGDIKVTRASSERAPTALVLGENILAATATLSFLERYSEYIVKGQRPRDDDSFGEEITTKQGRATDGELKRYRPCIEIMEDVGDADVLQKRAAWRRNVNAGRSARATVTVQGWSHARGLWKPNTRVPVTDARLRMLNRDLQILSVRYVLDSGGTRAELTLAPPEALTPEEIPEKDAEALL